VVLVFKGPSGESAMMYLLHEGCLGDRAVGPVVMHEWDVVLSRRGAGQVVPVFESMDSPATCVMHAYWKQSSWPGLPADSEVYQLHMPALAELMRDSSSKVPSVQRALCSLGIVNRDGVAVAEQEVVLQVAGDVMRMTQQDAELVLRISEELCLPHTVLMADPSWMDDKLMWDLEGAPLAEFPRRPLYRSCLTYEAADGIKDLMLVITNGGAPGGRRVLKQGDPATVPGVNEWRRMYQLYRPGDADWQGAVVTIVCVRGERVWFRRETGLQPPLEDAMCHVTPPVYTVPVHCVSTVEEVLMLWYRGLLRKLGWGVPFTHKPTNLPGYLYKRTGGGEFVPQGGHAPMPKYCDRKGVPGRYTHNPRRWFYAHMGFKDVGTSALRGSFSIRQVSKGPNQTRVLFRLLYNSEFKMCRLYGLGKGGVLDYAMEGESYAPMLDEETALALFCGGMLDVLV
jgi:hypothetical protein